MKPFKWIKDHPVEAAAIAAGLALTGGAAAGAFGAGAAGAGTAGTLALETGGPALLGADVATGASLGAGAAGAGGSSALLAPMAAGEDFAAQMAGNTISGSAGDASGMVGSGAFGPAAGQNTLPYTLGDQAALFDTAGLGSPLMAGQAPFAPGAVTGAHGMTAAYGPAAAGGGTGESAWLAKLKDPKTVMHLGMMAAQLGAPHGGPAPMTAAPQMRQAQMSQEQITKKWLMQNDPNTYRRIYGDPQQGVA